MIRIRPSLVCLAILAHACSALAQVSPSTPVVVDSTGKVVGVLVEGGLESEIAHVALEVRGRAGVLLGVRSGSLSSTGLYFESNDCTGTPYAIHHGSPSNVFGGSFFVVADTAQGDLYAIDPAELVPFTYSSRLSLATCTPSTATVTAYPATLVEAGWELGNFDPPFRIEARAIAAPRLTSVPAVGPIGLGMLALLIVTGGLLLIRLRS